MPWTWNAASFGTTMNPEALSLARMARDYEVQWEEYRLSESRRLGQRVRVESTELFLPIWAEGRIPTPEDAQKVGLWRTHTGYIVPVRLDRPEGDGWLVERQDDPFIHTTKGRVVYYAERQDLRLSDNANP